MTVAVFLRVLEYPLKETAKESTYRMYAQLYIMQMYTWSVTQRYNIPSLL